MAGRVPPQKGDVWRNKNSGGEVEFSGDAIVNPLAAGVLHIIEGYKDIGYATIRFTDGTLEFVRYGFGKCEPSAYAPTSKTPKNARHPHKCNRCGQPALILSSSIECSNTKCMHFTARF